MFVLELLGTLSLRCDARPVPVAAQQKRPLGLLAILGLGGRQGLSRERIETYLWPESSSTLARHALDQTVYSIRHALGNDFILSTGRELRLNPELVQIDVWQFEEAIRTRQWAAAVGHYKGPLLDGFHFADSRELESWIDAERARLRLEYQTAIESLANASAEAGDHSQSVSWWRRLANSDPLSAGATKKLMLALAAAGDRAGAVKHARLYQELVRQDLEIEPDSEIEDLASMLSHPASTEPAAPHTLENETQDGFGSANSFAEAPSNPSFTPRAARGVKGKQGSHRERRMWYTAAALAILISATGIWGWMRPAPSKDVLRYTLVVDSTEAMVPGTSSWVRLALSPDGSRLAYIGGQRAQLLIRLRNQLHAIAIPGTEGANTPFFSPDGQHVGFFIGKTLHIVSLDEGPPITVTDSLTGVSGASWGPDHLIYADGFGHVGLVRVEDKPGAVPTAFTMPDTARGEFELRLPDVLPNGKGVLFTVTFSGKNAPRGKTSFSIAVADIPSGKHRVLVNDAMYARYAASGHLVYVTTDRTLMVVPFDQNSMKVTGEPTALTEDMRLGNFDSPDLAISERGTLVFATSEGEAKQELVWVTRDGKAQSVDPDWQGGSFADPALSPDGKQLAVAWGTGGETGEIWIKQLDRGPSYKLTHEGSQSAFPSWTPDSRSLTFSSDPAGPFDLWTKRADGSGQAVRQFHEGRNLFDACWSPNGRWLIFNTSARQPGSGDILGIRPGIDTVAVPLVATKFTEFSPALSPDGRWLAYASDESGQIEIYVVPFPNTSARKWAVSTRGGTEPRWSHSGRELFYRDSSGSLVAARVKTTPTFSLGRSTTLFPAGGFSSFQYSPQYDVSLDDRRFLMIRSVAGSDPDKLIVVENWFEELKPKPRK
jgi:DNA-binding SARP family transcriptional activator